MINPLHLFEGYGVELEYMIVDKDTLAVKPITDEVIKEAAGEYTSDWEEGEIAWSNELVLHVIEFKTNGPAKSLDKLSQLFHKNVLHVNQILNNYNAVLMPAGAHPLMNPYTETKLWPHENNPVYELYNSIFDCRGHGWSNLQSIHLNLPFFNDEEFEQLHAAIRLILPIIPAIAASTPILDGANTNFLDARLETYRKNQIKIPSITGSVIPEPVFSIEEYKEKILNKIYKDIFPFDEEKILQHEWLNSRGAIARFDRNTFEIRIIDMQECPDADLAIVKLISSLLKNLVDENFTLLENQKRPGENELSKIFLDVIKYGENTIITDAKYLKVFKLGGRNEITAKELWKHIISKLEIDSHTKRIIDKILQNGSLSSRILTSLKNDFSAKNILKTYRKLSVCLTENKMFIP